MKNLLYRVALNPPLEGSVQNCRVEIGDLSLGRCWNPLDCRDAFPNGPPARREIGDLSKSSGRQILKALIPNGYSVS